MKQTQVTTTDGFVVSMKAFITGADMRDMNDSWINSQEKDSEGRMKITPKSLNERLDCKIRNIVLSVDGENIDKSSDIVMQVLSLPISSYNEIVVAVEDIANGKKNVKNSETTSNIS